MWIKYSIIVLYLWQWVMLSDIIHFKIQLICHLGRTVEPCMFHHWKSEVLEGVENPKETDVCTAEN